MKREEAEDALAVLETEREYDGYFCLAAHKKTSPKPELCQALRAVGLV